MRVQEATGKRRLRKETEMWGRESRVLSFILHAVFCKLWPAWAHVVYWYVIHCMIDCAFAKYQPCILSPWSFFIPFLSSILILKILSDLLWVLSTLLLPPPSTLSFPSHSVKIRTGASFSLTNLEVVLDIHTGQKNPANLHGVQGCPLGMTDQLSAQVKACTLQVPLGQLWFWGRVVEDRKDCCSSIPEQRQQSEERLRFPSTEAIVNGINK